MGSDALKAPFPYFGGKSRIADAIWARLGDVDSYVEPFCGSCATLLRAPWPSKRREVVNDADGLLVNFWRAVKHAPDAVAEAADWPVFEADLHARHRWLVGQRESLTERLLADPDWHDAKAAGWWVWGASCWIGSGWCRELTPQMPKIAHGRSLTCSGQAPRLTAKQGVNVAAQVPKLVERSIIHERFAALHERFAALHERFAAVYVLCGGWERTIASDSAIFGDAKNRTAAILLDPPYADTAERTDGLYAQDCSAVAHDVREWALTNGDNPRLRIALCGYDGEHEMPESWECMAWEAAGGYGNQGESNDNRRRERVWFSPHCKTQRRMF